MSLIDKIGKRKASTATKKVTTGKSARRVFATLGASFMLGGSMLGLAACGKNQQVEVNPVEQTNSQQAKFNELQEQIKQLQNEMEDLRDDVSSLKKNDVAMLKLITENMAIVQNLIADLQEKISSISSQTTENKQDIDSLKQSQKSISSQLSTLQSNMQSFERELETLKGQTTDAADSKTIKDLQKTVAEMQTQIHKLTLQNAINYSFNTRYSYLTTHGLEGGNIESWIAPNGEYVYEKGHDAFALCEDELTFVRENGEEQIFLDTVGNGDASTPMSMLYSSVVRATSIVLDESQGSLDYIVTDSLSNVDLTYSIDNGYLVEVTQGETSFLLYDDNIQNYNTNKILVSSSIGMYQKYKDLKQAFGNTSKHKYGQIQTDTTKMVFASDGYGMSQEVGGTDGGVAVGYCEDGKAEVAYDYNDGAFESESFDNQAQLSFKDYIEGYFTEIFWGHNGDTATISYNKKQNSYSVTVNSKDSEQYVYSFVVNENGEVSNFTGEFHYSDGDVDETKFTISNLTKAQAQKIYDEIKAQYEDLLAKNDENKTGI